MAIRGRTTAATEMRIRQFAGAVFEHGDIRAAAAAQGIPERTAYRWTAHVIYRDAMRDTQAEGLREATRGLYAGAGEAVATLRAIVLDTEADAAVRVRACAIVLDAALKLSAHVEIEARLLELERKMPCNTWN